MNYANVLLVVLAWSVSPVFRRAAIDKMGEGSSASFVVYSSVVCAVVALAGACTRRNETIAYVREGGSLAFGFVCMISCFALASNYLLATLIAKNNPGQVVGLCNGLSNLTTYLAASLFYNAPTMQGIIGAMLVSAGVYLLRTG